MSAAISALPSYDEMASLADNAFVILIAAATYGDERLLPSVLQELAVTFNTTLTDLGWLTFAGFMAAALATPIAGELGDVFKRGRIMIGALSLFCVTGVLMAVSQNLQQLIFFRALNGACVGFNVPLLFSVVGDLNSEKQRGAAFGTLALVGNMGAIMG
ncbi:major facilitator superfamily domain-containing protein, partial [Baffinella frigidus]